MSHRRIAVIGNCQAHGLATCIGAMSSDADVSNHWFHTFLGKDPDINVFARDYDDVLLLTGLAEQMGANDETLKKLTPVPVFNFTAFHPDAIGARYNGKTIISPIGEVNSSIALHAWRSGMTVEQALSLFDRRVFEKLGFFSMWEQAKAELQALNKDTEFDVVRHLGKWMKHGCFAYLPNHPRIFVLADIARYLVAKIGMATKTSVPEYFVHDSLSQSTIWPVYPEIADRLGVPGDYGFKASIWGCADDIKGKVLSLEEYVSMSFQVYEDIDRQLVECERLKSPEFQELDHFLSTACLGTPSASAEAPHEAARSRNDNGSENPYKKLPDYCFWPRAVAPVAVGDLDPVVPSKLAIGREDRIATAGSCFAQHISKALQGRGFNYLVTETAPPDLPPEIGHQRNFGTFTARYGNIYTARQLLQLIERAYGRFEPDEIAWERKSGAGLADPFRPLVEPDGFSTVEELIEARQTHFSAVRCMFESLDYFVFTLGLTEAWCSKSDGAVFPLAPGVVAGRHDPDRIGFVNFSAAEVVADMGAFIERLRDVNPQARIILTVSPVPLVATYEDRHVLTSTTYSKSVLRVAADELSRRYRDVSYFPSYEIIVGSYNRGAYFEPDLRSVTREGVDHVMRLFMKHFTSDAADSTTATVKPPGIDDLICDENYVAF